jgi:hypothetical protein
VPGLATERSATGGNLPDPDLLANDNVEAAVESFKEIMTAINGK